MLYRHSRVHEILPERLQVENLALMKIVSVQHFYGCMNSFPLLHKLDAHLVNTIDQTLPSLLKFKISFKAKFITYKEV